MVQERPDRPMPFATWSRRAVLTRGGVAATGAGAVVVGAVAVGAIAHQDGTVNAGQPGETVFNVRDFGAVGDAKADDTASIQHAIDKARGGGGVVLLPPGTYLTGRLTLYSRVHLRGS
ncbi:MAG: hypothetical protein V7603_3309, partial [Micromonosporaceae bacterium]